MTGTMTLREAWEAGLVLPEYWLPQRKTLSDVYLPPLREIEKIEGHHPIWYINTLTLAAGATGRMRISVEPDFKLTMIMGTASAANPADGLGSAQAQIYDTARRARFSSRPIVSPVVFGVAGDPFILYTPYTWTGTAPVLIVLQNRNVSASNTITLVLHGWRKR